MAIGYTRVDSPPIGGNCVGHDVRMWFPHAERTNNRDFSAQYRKAGEHTITAKAICDDCPQKVDCLNYALYHEMFGIWGGTTERERKLLRKKYNILMIQREPFIPVGPRPRNPK